jgi:hypothetical protein
MGVQANLDINRMGGEIERLQSDLQIQVCPFDGASQGSIERGLIFFGADRRVGKCEISFSMTQCQPFFIRANFQFMEPAVPLAVRRIKSKGVGVLAVGDRPLHGSFNVIRVV